MQFLKANTQVIVTVGPFVDVGDGFTPQTDITLGGNEAEILKHGATAVVSIAAATWAAVTSCRGYYSLTLTTSHTDTEGMLVVIVQDDSDCLPVKQEYMVLAEAAYDSMFTAKDTGFMDVNVKAVSEDTTAADNAEAFFDGTGYAGTNNVIPTVTTLTGHTAQTGDSFARIGAAGASLTNLGGSGNNWNTTTPPTAAANADAVWDEAVAGHVGAGSFGATDAAILADTNELQTNQGNWLTATGFATSTKQDTMETTLNAAATTVELDKVPKSDGAVSWNATALTAVEDQVWDALLTGASHNTSTSAGRRLRQIDAAFVVTEGTADAGGASTIDLETGVADGTTNDIYAGDRILIVAGTGAGEHGLVLSYEAVTNQRATMSKPWVITPSTDSEYIIVPADCDVELWNDNSVTGDGDWAGDNAATQTLASGATGFVAIDTVVDAIKVITDALTSAGAANLALSAAGIIGGTTEGTQTTVAVDTDLTGYVTGELVGRVIIFTSGTGDGQAATITAYTSTNGKVEFAALTTAPSTSTFVIV